MLSFKTAVFNLLFAASALAVDTAERASVGLDLDGRVHEHEPLSLNVSGNGVQFQSQPVQVISNFLDDQELAYFNKQADKATVERLPGILINDAELHRQLVHRFDCLWHDERCAQGPPQESVTAHVSHFKKSSLPHSTVFHRTCTCRAILVKFNDACLMLDDYKHANTTNQNDAYDQWTSVEA